MVRQIADKLQETFAGKIAQTALALLLVGAIGSGIGLARSVDAMAEQIKQMEDYSRQVNDQQSRRLDRHGQRITYLERQARAARRATEGLYWPPDEPRREDIVQ